MLPKTFPIMLLCSVFYSDLSAVFIWGNLSLLGLSFLSSYFLYINICETNFSTWIFIAPLRIGHHAPPSNPFPTLSMSDPYMCDLWLGVVVELRVLPCFSLSAMHLYYQDHCKSSLLALYNQWEHGSWASTWFLVTMTIIEGMTLGCSRPMDQTRSSEVAGTTDINMTSDSNPGHGHLHGFGW